MLAKISSSTLARLVLSSNGGGGKEIAKDKSKAMKKFGGRVKMADTKGTIIELTEEQKKLMRQATGTEHEAFRVEVATHIQPAEMISKRGLGKRGLGKRGLGKRGLGKRGLGKRGLGKRGLGKRGLGKRGLGKRGLGKRGLGKRGLGKRGLGGRF